MLDNLVKKSLAKCFYTLKAHDHQLTRRYQLISDKAEAAVKAKLLYKWYARYYEEAQKTYVVYKRGLKQKSLTALILNRRKAAVMGKKAERLRKDTMKVKAIQIWIAFTKDA